MAGRQQQRTKGDGSAGVRGGELARKREALAEAERALAAAEAAMDAEGVVAATQRAVVLRRFIAKLEAEAGEVLAEDARRRAKGWCEAHVEQMVGVREAVVARQRAVREQLTALIAAIEAERALRKSAEAGILATQVLAARFGLPAEPERVGLPPLEDYSVPVMKAVDAMRPSRQARRGITVGHRNSATAEEMRRDVLRAVHVWVAQFGATLPPEVQAILADAPIPADVLPAPKKEPTPDEVRQMERMARDVAEAQRALAAVPGFTGGVAGI